MRTLLTALTALMLFATVLPAHTEEYTRQFNVKQFAGWEGIGLQCSLSPVNDFTNDLCEWSKAKARLMAVTAGIPFFAATKPNNHEDWYFTAYKKGQSQALMLQIRIISTAPEPREVFVEVRAAPFYTDAIEHNASPDIPTGQPKSGDLVLWATHAVGSGAALKSEWRSTLELMLTQFFADFISYRQ